MQPRSWLCGCLTLPACALQAGLQERGILQVQLAKATDHAAQMQQERDQRWVAHSAVGKAAKAAVTLMEVLLPHQGQVLQRPLFVTSHSTLLQGAEAAGAQGGPRARAW